jgi:hypothetical protein
MRVRPFGPSEVEDRRRAKSRLSFFFSDARLLAALEGGSRLRSNRTAVL